MGDLLENGADVDWQDSDGDTALHWSFEEICTLALLRHGANVHAAAEGRGGLTPLWAVVMRTCQGLVPVEEALRAMWHLIDFGAEVDAGSAPFASEEVYQVVMKGASFSRSSYHASLIHIAQGELDCVRNFLKGTVDAENRISSLT